MMSALVQEIRLGLRALRKRPLATALAVLALGLGIGANAALFSAVDAVLLRPFPFAEQERLVVVWEKDLGRGMERVEVSLPELRGLAPARPRASSGSRPCRTR